MVWTNGEASLDTVLAAPSALIGRTITGPVHVHVRDGRIVRAEPARSAGRTDAEVLESGLLTAGLIDVQVNGAFGRDFADIDEDGMRLISRSFVRSGVTRFLPTLITAPVPKVLRQAHTVLAASAAIAEEPGARSLGVHLEGPFLSPQRHGVHDPALMESPTADRIDALLDDPVLLAGLRMVTLAPERPGALEAIRRLVAAGVLVSVGHTDATAEQTRAAADAGARMITHLFNAQRGLGHREPGVPGAALSDDRFALGLIGDLAHVAGDICKLVFLLAADRVVLVTDAVAPAGMPPGRYQLGGSEVLLTEQGVPHAPDGTFAGGALTLDRAVRNIISLGVDPAVALTSATELPADTVGEPALGRIAPGAVADLVWWDENLRPRKVWVAGQLAYDAAADAEADADAESSEDAQPLHASA
jgi:N-acetylglucosamine-6-phosphate deacetylase